MAAVRAVSERTDSDVPPRRLDFIPAVDRHVVLANFLGNFSLSWGINIRLPTGRFPRWPNSNHLYPVGVARNTLLIVWLLSRMTLLSWAVSVTCCGDFDRYVLTRASESIFFAANYLAARWDLGDHRGIILVRPDARIPLVRWHGRPER